jgi:6-pyruvoyltetrahydropterin/6-carboxytetrahydropterin synthase
MDKSAHLTLRVKFSALHELSSPELSKEENEEVFGKCFRTHGHDYALEVTVLGEIDPLSGLICNRDLLQDILDREIVNRFHGTHLNLFFESTTGEELAREFFRVLKEKLTKFNLVSVRLQETPKNFFSYSSFGKDFALLS